MNPIRKVALYSALIGILGFWGNALAQEGKRDVASRSTSIETVLKNISLDGKDKTTFSLIGNYFSMDSKSSDGLVIVNQNGELHVQTLGEDAEGNLTYGPLKRIGNTFEGRQPDGNYIVKGIHSVDLNQDGLHDIVVDVTDISVIQTYGKDIATTKDFYFATGNGNFSKGKSEVYFRE